MTIHPQEHVPITKAPPRKSDVAIPLALLAVAVMLGLGITAFSSTPYIASVAPTTVGQITR
jgi:hypothetical protein